MEEELFKLVILACIDLCRYKSFRVNINLELGYHWWFDYPRPSPFLDVELEFTCFSG